MANTIQYLMGNNFEWIEKSKKKKKKKERSCYMNKSFAKQIMQNEMKRWKNRTVACILCGVEWCK